MSHITVLSDSVKVLKWKNKVIKTLKKFILLCSSWDKEILVQKKKTVNKGKK